MGAPFDVRNQANPGAVLAAVDASGNISATGTITTPAVSTADPLTGTIVAYATSATDSAAVTTETIVLTSSACTLRAGRAYAVVFGPNWACSDASGNISIKLRKSVSASGVTGTLLGATATDGSATAAGTVGYRGSFLIANSTKYPIHVPLVLTLENTAGGGATATMIATGTSTPRYLYVQDIGPASAFSAFAKAITDPFSESVFSSGTPVAYWTLGDLDQGLQDCSGNGRNLTKSGGVTVSTFTDTAGALAFNGLDGYLETPDADVFSVPTTGIVAYELWMRPDAQNWPTTTLQSADTDQYTHWFGKAGRNVNEYIFRRYNANAPTRPSRISTYAFNLSGGLGAGSYVQEPVPNGEWDYYVGVLNSTDTTLSPYGRVRIYKNGAQKDSDGMGSPYFIVPRNGAAPLRIGTASKQSFAQAGIARVVFWNREPSASEILTRYRTVVPVAVGTASYTRTVTTGTSNGVAGTTVVLTVGTSMAAGSRPVIVAFGSYTAGAVTVADSKGNTWTSKRTGASTGNLSRLTTFTCNHTSQLTAGSTVTVTWPSSVTIRLAALIELASTTETADAANGRVGNDAAPHIETTTTHADDILIDSLGIEYNYTAVNIQPFDSAWTTAALIGYNDPTTLTSGRGLLVGIRSVPATGLYDYQASIGTLDGGDQTAGWIGQVVPLQAV